MLTITDNPKIKTSELMDTLRKQVEVYSYWNNAELDKNFLPPKETTTRTFAATPEPDKETLGKSYDQLFPAAQGMTFREYILAQMQYFKETGKYLDEKGWTVFSDERLPSGGVASGYWDPNGREIKFYWGNSDFVSPLLGARLAISPSSSNLVPSAADTLEKRIEALEAFRSKVEGVLKLN